MRNRLVAIAAGLLAVAFALAQSPMVKVKEGDLAPDFSVQGSDGKTHTLKSLTEKGPVFLYFVKAQCSANPTAQPIFNEIYKEYGKKVTFVGVINADAEGFKAWQEQFKGQYLTLLDPDKTIIGAYGVKRSQPTIMVGKDGKVVRVFSGFGRQALNELSVTLATEAGSKKSLDFPNASDGDRYG